MAPTPYNDDFQEEHLAGSLASAAAVLPILFEYFRPKSVIDIGCGLGAWLKVAGDLGVADILGFDGDSFDLVKLLIDPGNFKAVDLAERFAVNRRFDLAISLESAEHLPYSRSGSFVADLAKLSDVVLFSAAAPYQGGTNHINEQWLEFWAILFRRFDYVACDALRDRIWTHPDVEFWYKQNMLIFCKTDLAPSLFPPEAIAGKRALSFAHPESSIVNAARYRPLSPQARETERLDYTALLASYVAGETVLPPLKMPDAATADQTRLFPEARTRIIDAGAEFHRLRTTLYESNNEIHRLNNETYRLNCEIGEHKRDLAAQAQEARERDAAIAELMDDIAHAQHRLRRMEIALSARNGEVLFARRSIAQKLLRRLESLHSAISPQARITRDIELIGVSGLFDRAYYLSQNPRLETLDLDPVRHYVEHGATEGRDPHPLFDTSFYLETNPDVARSRMNPLAHYHAYGGAERRDPHPSFDTSAYLTENPEAIQAGMTPLLHYQTFHLTS